VRYRFSRAIETRKSKVKCFLQAYSILSKINVTLERILITASEAIDKKADNSAIRKTDWHGTFRGGDITFLE
jgi:hypothetical protein